LYELLSIGSTLPPEEDVLGSAALLLVAAAPATADELVAVVPLACSDAPLSLPQLLLNHVVTCWLSTALVQTEAQMPAGVLCMDVHTDWQKQDQMVVSVVLVPPHVCSAVVSVVQLVAHDGSALLPSVRSWAEVEAMREERRMVRVRCGVMA